MKRQGTGHSSAERPCPRSHFSACASVQAAEVLAGLNELIATAPDELTVQIDVTHNLAALTPEAVAAIITAIITAGENRTSP